MIPFLKKDWRERVRELSAVCSKLDGNFVPDDEEKAFACIVPELGLNITYFRDKDLYLVALTTGSATMSVATKNPPNFTVSPKSFLVEIEKPDVVKVFTSNQ